MVQRVLTTKDLSSGRKAMIGSGIFVLIQFTIFLFAGSLIHHFLGGAALEKDREFSTFIVQYLPAGLRGLLLAGILSAAMSTDFLFLLRKGLNDVLSLFLGILIPAF